jgi:hypothetical protein
MQTVEEEGLMDNTYFMFTSVSSPIASQIALLWHVPNCSGVDACAALLMLYSSCSCILL